MRRLFFALLPGLLAAAALRGEEIRITRGRFDGLDCYTLDNGVLELKAVPGINRIVSLRLRETGENLLWYGKSDKYPGWINYGGSKLWPGPQSRWKRDFPPEPELDQLPGTAEVRDGTLLLRTPDAPAFGIRFTREISLRGNTVLLRESMTNVSANPVEWTIWEVSQCVTGGTVTIRGTTVAGLEFSLNPLLVPPETAGGAVTVAARPEQRFAKIRHPASASSVEYRVNGVRLIRKTENLHSETYIGNGYVELETNSPPFRLAPGETAVMTHEWQLLAD